MEIIEAGDGVLEWFDSKGIRRIEGVVAARNEPPASFRRKHGFRYFEHLVYLERDNPGCGGSGPTD